MEAPSLYALLLLAGGALGGGLIGWSWRGLREQQRFLLAEMQARRAVAEARRDAAERARHSLQQLRSAPAAPAAPAAPSIPEPAPTADAVTESVTAPAAAEPGRSPAGPAPSAPEQVDRAAVEQLQARIAGLHAELGARDARVAHLETRLQAAEAARNAEAARLHSESSGHTTRQALLDARLRSAADLRERAESQLQSATQQLHERETRIAELTTQVATLGIQLRKAREAQAFAMAEGRREQGELLLRIEQLERRPPKVIDRVVERIVEVPVEVPVEVEVRVEVPTPSSPRRFQRDELTQIDGIDPRAARALHRAGVTLFRQLAAWTDADIERFEAMHPEFRGRARRHGWVDQARQQRQRRPLQES